MAEQDPKIVLPGSAATPPNRATTPSPGAVASAATAAREAADETSQLREEVRTVAQEMVKMTARLNSGLTTLQGATKAHAEATDRHIAEIVAHATATRELRASVDRLCDLLEQRNV